jgi:hypothetical protein
VVEEAKLSRGVVKVIIETCIFIGGGEIGACRK